MKDLGETFYQYMGKEFDMKYIGGDIGFKDDSSNHTFFKVNGDVNKCIKKIKKSHYMNYIEWLQIVDTKYYKRNNEIENCIDSMRNLFDNFSEMSEEEFSKSIDIIKDQLENLKSN